jgi:hypothetical protein
MNLANRRGFFIFRGVLRLKRTKRKGHLAKGVPVSLAKNELYSLGPFKDVARPGEAHYQEGESYEQPAASQ